MLIMCRLIRPAPRLTDDHDEWWCIMNNDNILTAINHCHFESNNHCQQPLMDCQPLLSRLPVRLGFTYQSALFADPTAVEARFSGLSIPNDAPPAKCHLGLRAAYQVIKISTALRCNHKDMYTCHLEKQRSTTTNRSNYDHINSMNFGTLHFLSSENPTLQLQLQLPQQRLDSDGRAASWFCVFSARPWRAWSKCPGGGSQRVGLELVGKPRGNLWKPRENLRETHGNHGNLRETHTWETRVAATAIGFPRSVFPTNLVIWR